MDIQYDGIITISTGNSRKEKKWINQEMLWSEFLDKLSETTRTTETVEEFRKMPKAEQDDRKDCGGFVGGRLKDGVRKTANVEHRNMLTLDMDYAEGYVWNAITTFNDFACCIYSTHKHTTEAPRLRLVIPLARTVTPEEYVAVARWVAAEIDIEQFDDTTFEPARLMYLPSTSCDGEYINEFQDAEWLDPDKVLATYPDWRDTSSWAFSSRVRDRYKKSADMQGNPLEKPGVIGAFCRTYSVTDVLEKFLCDKYSSCDMENRYSYIAGSTSGGLVIYDDDTFAYSHHGTDPISGKLVNSFDLVRIHMFGHLDEDVKEGTPAGKLPSFIAMKQLAEEDEAVRQLMEQERQEAARADFVDPIKVFFANKKFVPKYLAEWFLDRYHVCIINDNLYVYEKGRYVPGEQLFRAETTLILGKEFSTHRVSEALNYIKNVAERVTPDEAASTGEYLNLANGLLHLGTFELLPHKPELKTIIQIPVEYNPNAQCTAIDEFLARVAPEYVDTLYEIVGYCLQPSMWLERSFLFKGPGKNGKGTFLAVLQKLFGSGNVSNVHLHALSENRFLAAELFGKMVNLHADLPKRLIEDTSSFKQLTSGDSILVERKFETPFSFHNRAKLLFSANELSPTKDNSDGYYRRWLILPFERTFDDGELRGRLFDDAEMSGLLIKALEGLKRLRRQNGFTIPNELEQIRENYRFMSDSAYHFLKEYCCLETGVMVGKQDLYQLYRECCGDWGCIAVNQAGFNAKLKTVYPEVREDKNHGERRWKGLSTSLTSPFMTVVREKVG